MCGNREKNYYLANHESPCVFNLTLIYNILSLVYLIFLLLELYFITKQLYIRIKHHNFKLINKQRIRYIKPDLLNWNMYICIKNKTLKKSLINYNYQFTRSWFKHILQITQLDFNKINTTFEIESSWYQ